MKALISPNELRTYRWISNWEQGPEELEPIYSFIENYQRVAQVVNDTSVFEVALPLYWSDCPDNCEPDKWGYKDNTFILLPSNVTQL